MINTMRTYIQTLTTMALLLASSGAMAGDDPAPFRKIAVIGASASAGFGVITEVRVDEERTQWEGISIGDVLQESGEERLVILDLASGGFFTNPFQIGRSSIDRTNQWEADLAVGIDFLFWYVYGGTGAATPDEVMKVRLQDLETGLAELGRLRMPMVIGEIPDMSPAIGGMLTRRQVPSPKTLDAVNTRIRAWAAERDDVALVPLTRITEDLRGDTPFTIGDQIWDPGDADTSLLLPDRLHPTLDGLIALTQAMAEAVRSVPKMADRLSPLVLKPGTLKAGLRGESESKAETPSPASP